MNTQISKKKKKKNLQPYLIPHIKTNSKWINGCKCKKKKLDLNLYDLGVDKNFLGHKKTQTIKENIDKMDFVKIESFCSMNNTFKTMKR